MRQQTVAELREFLAARPAGDDRVMVAAFEQNLRVLLLPTTDRASIIAGALDELEKVPVRALLGLSEKNRLEQDVRAYGKNALRVEASLGRRPSQEGFERVVTTRRAEALRLEHEITVWAEQELERERRSIVALERLVGALAAVEGRKAVVLATAGIQGFPARGLFAALDQQRQGPVKLTSSDTNRAPTLEVRGQELLLAFEQMVQAAQNARVAFYTVSPGAPPPPDNSAEFAGTGATSARMLPRDTGVVEAASSVARLAGATGGASFTVGTDLDGRLAAVTADGDAAYSLGFTTSATAGEKDHKIEVRTLRAGLEVRHRESFRRRSAPQRAEAALAAAVTFGQAENPLEIALQLGPAKAEGKKRSGQSVPLAVGIPLRFVTLVPEGELRRGSVSVRVAIQDARGRMLESSAAIVPIVVPEDQMAKAMESSWYHRAEMRLAPGRQRVAVVVLDEISGSAVDHLRGDRDSREEMSRQRSANAPGVGTSGSASQTRRQEMHVPQDRVRRSRDAGPASPWSRGANGAESERSRRSRRRQAAAEDFTERVDVEVVNVDVVVTDKAKRRILDLGRDDFELLVDGRPVAIEYFAGPRLAGATAPAPAAAPAGGGDRDRPRRHPLQPAAPTNLILYIDQTALESQDRKTALEELREFLRGRPAGADRVTVAAFDQRLQIVAPATTDPAAIAAAFDQIESRPSFAALGLGEERQLQREIRDLGTYGGDARTIEQAIVSWGEQQIDRERRSIAALASAGRLLGGGRRPQSGRPRDGGHRGQPGAVPARRARPEARRPRLLRHQPGTRARARGPDPARRVRGDDPGRAERPRDLLQPLAGGSTPRAGGSRRLGCRVELRSPPAARLRGRRSRREHRAPDRCHRRGLVHDLGRSRPSPGRR